MNTMEESLKIIAERVKNHEDTMQTEEAVKTAVVLPFLRALGYDVFNPLEVIPEFCADVVGKKGEKVDFAVCIDGQIRILFECKPILSELCVKHLSQLYRYFSVTDAKFAILTNGRYFQFYTDLDAPNKLDTRPFLTFDVTDYNLSVLTELKKFERSAFNIDSILATAERLKYIFGIKQNILKEMETPSDELVRVFSKDVFDGRFSAQALEMLKNVTKSAFREVISEMVKSRLSTALKTTTDAEEKDISEGQCADDDEIYTTQEEIEAYMIIKAIVREVIEVERVVMRDAKSYCAVLIDDNNRKPLARLHFNAKKTKQIGLFDEERDDRIDIVSLDDIYDLSERLKKTAQQYV